MKEWVPIDVYLCQQIQTLFGNLSLTKTVMLMTLLNICFMEQCSKLQTKILELEEDLASERQEVGNPIPFPR